MRARLRVAQFIRARVRAAQLITTRAFALAQFFGSSQSFISILPLPLGSSTGIFP